MEVLMALVALLLGLPLAALIVAVVIAWAFAGFGLILEAFRDLMPASEKK